MVNQVMKFCDECGTTLLKDWENQSFVCKKCNTEKTMEENIVYQNKNSDTDKIIVVGRKEKNLKTLPETDARCHQCGNSKAYWWMVQTRSIDESSTQFFRCTKCGHTWREYN
jgi:DNA-directed RNA polymerase subunit M